MAWGFKQREATDLKQRTQWYAFVRLLFLLAISIPGFVSLLVFNGWSTGVRTGAAIVVIAISSNLVFYGLTNIGSNPKYLRILAASWIVMDILLIGLFILFSGGVESRASILFTIPMLIAAALFERRGLYVTAFACALVYILLICGDYLGIIHSMDGYNPMLHTNLAYVIVSITFVPSIIFVVAFAIDFITTLLIEKQKQVNESIMALENAQEIAKLGSWEWDITRDEITWSKELYRIYGVEPNDKKLTYRAYLKMLHPSEADTHQKTVINAMKEKINFAVNHRINLPNGSIRYVHGEGRPIKDKTGKIIKMSGTSQDVTDLYHLDIAKREFVSLASHQLRTPASGVKAFLSLLMDGHGGKLNRRQRQFLKQAYEANDKQLGIIDNLLSLASIESGKLTIQKELIDIQDTVKCCISAHLPHVKQKKQRVVFRKTRKQLFVRADPNVLNMAIDNLISNAIKYSPEHGRITLSTRHNKSSVYIDVSDNGIGIAKKDIGVLFQKFSRINDPASKTVGGSGLGLYMAKYIVDLHGGKISVRSRHGAGTTFTIKLSLSSQKGVE